MIETINVSSRGQIVIPEKVRAKLEIKEGTKLVLIKKGRRIILEREDDFLIELDKNQEAKEKAGWLLLADKAMAKMWDNPKDQKTWSKYV